jgi:hypothetical protein
MNGEERIPRSRGAVCGALLILFGVWGGLAPFVGPYFHFGYTPDSAWAYNSGRLYYSIIPGAAVVLGGVLITVTRNRLLGIAAGVLGVLGGAWFAVGTSFVTDVLYRSISVGTPIVPPGGPASLRSLYLETISLFSGLGILILLAGAIAIGRFSMVAAKDVVDAADSYSYEARFPTAPTATKPDLSVTQPDLSQYPTSVSPSSGAPPFAPAPFPDTAPQSEQP